MNRAVAERPDEPVIERVLFSEGQIRARIQSLAAEISQDYAGADLVMAGILKGAQLFTCDLARSLRVPVSVDFLSLSRYKRSPQTRVVEITQDLEASIAGRDLLLVEDIVDTGLTLHYLIQQLTERAPRSISVCSLLDRSALRLADIPLRYAGFHVNEEFLVGYGLDYRERFREAPCISVLSREGWASPAE
ncbi:MAG TPA: hypoxanthine phosphoribosyltransferase [Acidobacteriota bacterium]|nr:hypoxanthine phosphoribosyltransferase [Acidobacteriota bacterium]